MVKMKRWVLLASAFLSACLMGAESVACASQTGGGLAQTVYESDGAAEGNTMSLAVWNAPEADRRELEKIITKAWDSQKNSCDISALNIPYSRENAQKVQEIYFNLAHDNPQYFYVDRTNVGWTYLVGGTMQNLKISYTTDKKLVKGMQKKFDAAVRKALSGVETSWSDLEKALYLHDYISTNCSYDNTLRKKSAYNALVEGCAVCEGYALAYGYLLDQVGIESEMVKSKSVNHAWNMVKLYGKYYHVDVTWDDPQNDRLGRAAHTYFLKSTDSFRGDGKHYAKNDWNVFGSWQTSLAASKTYDKAFWNDVDTAFSYCNGYWYAFDGSKGAVYRYINSGKVLKRSKKMHSVKDKWYVWGDSKRYFTKKFTSTAVYDGMLYYSVPTAVYQLDFGTGKSKKLYSLSSSLKKTGYIYGLFITSTGKLQLQLAKNDTEYGRRSTVKTIKKSTVYKINYRANGGTGKMASQSCRTGRTYKLSPNRFVRKGYKFNGWSTKANGKGSKYKNKAAVKNLKKKGTITLYARWKKI